MQSFAESRGEALIRLRRVSKQRIPATSGALEQVQKCCSWRLLFESHIRVPGDRVGMLFKKPQAGTIIRTTVNEVDFREILGSSGGLMDVVPAKVAAKLEGLLNR
jgi:hypothetical protein